MVRIAPVKLAYNSRALWFDARDLDMREGDAVIVLTARGLEFGHVAQEVFEADEAQVKKLKSPLKPVKRLATDEDMAQAKKLAQLGAEALPVFRQLAAETSDEMHPVAVEYLFGGDKAVFYFEAENRIDFRDLVHKLAAEFHVRVDMRQVGVRDEARMIGGIGHCGQELCCKRFGGDFNPVSIRMAKEQDLSLNPQKISGICGRLMCCLRYEYDAYKDFKSRAPKANSMVRTPAGPAKVVGLDVPREVITLRPEDGKDVKVPFSEMDPPEGDATRRTVVGEEAWERATDRDGLIQTVDARFSTTQFTGEDKLGEAKAVHRGGSSAAKKPRANAESDAASEDESRRRRRRRRRSTKVETEATTGAQASVPAADESDAAHVAGKGSSGEGSKRKGGMQPRRRKRVTTKTDGAASDARDRKDAQSEKSAPKKRSSKGGQNQGRAGGEASGTAQGRGQKAALRPGQKSSGLRQNRDRGAGAAADSPREGQSSHRTARRRTHKAGGPSKGSADGASREGGSSE